MASTFLKSKLASFHEGGRAARLRRLNRTPGRIWRDRFLGLIPMGILLWALGGPKGVIFVLKVLFVSLHVAAVMDIDLDREDRRTAVNGMLSALDKNSGSLR